MDMATEARIYNAYSGIIVATIECEGMTLDEAAEAAYTCIANELRPGVAYDIEIQQKGE